MSPRWIVPAHIGWRDVDADLVLFDEQSMQYHALNGVGSAIWRACARGAPRPDIVANLAATYDAPSESIAEQVDAFLEELVGAGLLLRDPGGA
ncbi:MAG: PqqD family protein [Rhizomicrobium sp.]